MDSNVSGSLLQMMDYTPDNKVCATCRYREVVNMPDDTGAKLTKTPACNILRPTLGDVILIRDVGVCRNWSASGAPASQPSVPPAPTPAPVAPPVPAQA